MMFLSNLSSQLSFGFVMMLNSGFARIRAPDPCQLAPVVQNATINDVSNESVFNWDGFKESPIFWLTQSVTQEGNMEFGRWVQG